MHTSLISFSLLSFAPVSPMTFIPLACAVVAAYNTFLLLPLVEMPRNTSPDLGAVDIAHLDLIVGKVFAWYAECRADLLELDILGGIFGIAVHDSFSPLLAEWS